MASYLIDVNLPRNFSIWAPDDCEFVGNIDPGWTDTQIWNFATAEGLTFVSKDADFSDRVLLSEAGPHVIHIRVGNMRLRAFHALLKPIWDEICRLSEQSSLVQVYTDRIESID